MGILGILGILGDLPKISFLAKMGKMAKSGFLGKWRFYPKSLPQVGSGKKWKNGIFVIFGETVKMGIPGKCEKWQKLGFWNVMIFVFPVWENIQEYG